MALRAKPNVPAFQSDHHDNAFDCDHDDHVETDDDDDLGGLVCTCYFITNPFLPFHQKRYYSELSVEAFIMPQYY